MLNENAKLWVAALRSGEYPQTTRCLANEHGFCCMGVACEVAIKNGLDVVKNSLPVGGEIHITYDGDTAILTDKMRNWLGLRNVNGAYDTPIPNVRSSLTCMNDEGASFSEIADIIESEPTGLFKVLV